jgi:hypothetical protein
MKRSQPAHRDNLIRDYIDDCLIAGDIQVDFDHLPALKMSIDEDRRFQAALSVLAAKGCNREALIWALRLGMQMEGRSTEGKAMDKKSRARLPRLEKVRNLINRCNDLAHDIETVESSGFMRLINQVESARLWEEKRPGRELYDSGMPVRETTLLPWIAKNADTFLWFQKHPGFDELDDFRVNLPRPDPSSEIRKKAEIEERSKGHPGIYEPADLHVTPRPDLPPRLRHKAGLEEWVEKHQGYCELVDVSDPPPHLDLPRRLRKKSELYEQWVTLASSNKLPKPRTMLQKLRYLIPALYVLESTGKNYFSEVAELLGATGIEIDEGQLSRELKGLRSGYPGLFGQVTMVLILIGDVKRCPK